MAGSTVKLFISGPPNNNYVDYCQQAFRLDEFPCDVNGPLMTLILLIPEDKFTEGMDEYEDFDPNAPEVSLSQPIPPGWKYKAVKLPGEVAFVSEEFGPINFGLTYRPNKYPHEAVREFLEKHGIE